MAKRTARDRVWVYTISSIYRNGNVITPAKIAEIADVSERMAREALMVMADAAVIERDIAPDGSVRYLPRDDVEIPDHATSHD